MGNNKDTNLKVFKHFFNALFIELRRNALLSTRQSLFCSFVEVPLKNVTLHRDIWEMKKIMSRKGSNMSKFV